MKIAKNLLEFIGHTPLMEVSSFSLKHGLKSPLIVKIELFNPSGSVKARAALAMVRNAEEKDVSLILEFIKKLADYEKRLDEVIATEEDIRYLS